MEIRGKTVLITGGGSGIGLAIAKEFASRGAVIILTGRDETKLNTAVAQIGKAYAIACDVSAAPDVKRLNEFVATTFHGIDILVNNAGVSRSQKPLGEAVLDNARIEMETNYFAVIQVTQSLLPELVKKSEAAIININSVLAYVPAESAATYSASKAAQHAFSLTLRLYFQRNNIAVKVFEVFPPRVATDMTRHVSSEMLSPEQVALDLADAVLRDEYVVRNGDSEKLYQLSLQDPDRALILINK